MIPHYALHAKRVTLRRLGDSGRKHVWARESITPMLFHFRTIVSMLLEMIKADRVSVCRWIKWTSSFSAGTSMFSIEGVICTVMRKFHNVFFSCMNSRQKIIKNAVTTLISLERRWNWKRQIVYRFGIRLSTDASYS